MFYTQKRTLITVFIFFIFSHISALNVKDADPEPFIGMETTSETSTNTTETTHINSINTFDTQPYNFSRETDTEKIVSYTIAYEDCIILNQDYYNKETGDSEHGKMQLYPDISLINEGKQSFDLSSDLNCNSQNNSNTINNSCSSNMQQKHDHMEEHLKDSLVDSRRQDINNTSASQMYAQHKHARAIQHQKALHELNKLRTSPINPEEIFALPSVQAHFKQFKYDRTEQYRDKKVFFFSRKQTFPTAESEIKFADALSIKVGEYLSQIRYANQIDAKAAFAELKKLWTWKRDHTFLTSSFVNGTGENSFITHLGIDIMAIAERDLISRPDYVAQHANPESFKTIQEFREKCINLQQKGDRSALFQEELQLRHQLFQNGKNDNFTTNVCYAIVEKIYSDSITNVLYEIAHAQSLEKAHNQLHYLEMQILDQAQQHNITLSDEIKDFIVKQYNFDPIEAAYNCYTSRSDYIKTVNDQPVLSDNNISPILHNIENKSLSVAHKELTHLQKQIIKTFESLNITDRITQKELIVKNFGIDILEQANDIYKNRSDHKELTNSFIPVDVHNTSINILKNSHDYASVGQQFDVMAKNVFHNSKLCRLDFVENIENHVIDSIHIIKAPQNDAEFVFNVTVVDHLLTDIQHTVDNIIEGKSTPYMQCIERGSELFTRTIVKFIEGLNPITQAKSIGELLQGAGHLTSHIIQHPIDSLHTLREINTKTCEFLVNTALFTSDTIFGTTYLTLEKYQQRSNAFWKTVQSVPAENIIDLVAQVAADFAFGKGFAKVFIYIKEIDVATKLENYAAKVADTLKQAVDTHLAKNSIMVTAEGVVLKTSNDLKKFGEKIKNSSLGQKTILRVNNMKEFFALPFGQTLQPHSLKTSYKYQKFSIYKLTQDIPGTELKEGFFYYIDSLHCDHLEVFSKNLKAIAVYNLDGTLNEKKLEAAKKAGRSIKKIMK
ncbi:MAG TPA: hypothetical protein VLB80_03365 [Candidatus Babeliales bacterium]|nr:hypothetical protein [Candidatus Babeliales bacterium]